MCSNFSDLKADRQSVSKRIKETKQLKKTLSLLVKHPDGENSLYRCGDCGQYWQGTRAWNWGNDEYVFKVPEIGLEVWEDEPFVQPDELIVYIGAMQHYINNLRPEDSNSKCQVDGCGKNSIKLSVYCLEHHIESLQRIGNLPKKPQGNVFPPYDEIR